MGMPRVNTLIPKSRQQIHKWLAASGIPDVRGKLEQGFKYETTHAHAQVGYVKIRLMDDQFSIEQNVNIESPGTFVDESDSLLHGLQAPYFLQDVPGTHGGTESHDRIPEVILVKIILGSRTIQGSNPHIGT